MKAFSFAALAAAFFLLVGNAISQTPTPKSTPGHNTDDIVKISTTLIQIDATVLDKSGKIVRNLTADDFEIYENGRKQKITNLSFIEPAPMAAAAATTERSSTVEKLSSSTKAPPLPVKLKTEQIRRTIALVVDDLGLSFETINHVKDGLKKFVDQQMQFGDLVAIIRTGAGAGFLQQFTSDKRILYTAIDKIRWNPSGNGKISIFRPVDPSDTARSAPGSAIVVSLDDPNAKANQALANGMETVALADARRLVNQTNELQDEIFTIGSLGAVNYVVDGMAKLPGRKAIMLFSEGFKLYTQDRQQQIDGVRAPAPRLLDALQRLTESANRNGVIIYPIDARGVMTGMMVGPDDSFEELDKYSQGQRSPSLDLAIDRSTELMETQQGLRALAEGTGGIAFVNNNDLNLGIKKALNDQEGYYLLGYQPEAETFDPKSIKFNKLDVKVLRPDLKVRYRSGFYGIRDNDTAAKPKTAREQIYGAIASPLNISEFKLQLASFFANDPKTGNFIRTMIYVDGDSLTFVDEGNGWQTARYDVVALLFGEKDTVVDEVSRKQTIRATADTLKEIREKGFVATILVPIKKPGAYQMRVVVRDDVTSKIGSASEFIQVPNIKKDQLYISGLLLQRSEDETPNAPKQFQTDGTRDLAARTFQPGMKLRLGFGIYNAKADSGSKSVDLAIQYRVFRDGADVYLSPPKRVTMLDQSDPHRVVAEDEFMLSPAIKPGNYIVQVIVKDRLAKDNAGVTYQFTDFDVVP